MTKKIFYLILISFCIYNPFANAQIGIGTETPDATAILDIVSSDKGVLLPRVNLTSNVLDIDGDTYQPKGLIIYNIGTTLPKGYYYWNGSEWRTIESVSASSPSIVELLCSGATLSPSGYYTNKDYVGVLRIPYKGGNGARYVGGDPVTANGLTFQLEDGKLEAGTGELVFNVKGRPLESSPVVTSFEVNRNIIPFFNGTCTIKVGDQVNADIKNIAVMAPLTYTTEGRAGYATVIDTPDGKFSIRCYLPSGNAFSSVNLQIRANSSTDVTISSTASYLWSGTATAAHRQLKLTANQWCGSDGDNAGVVTAGVQGASNFVEWGNPGVYASSRPEQRHYSFMTIDGDDKVFYNVRFMMGTNNPSGAANTTNCPGGTCGDTKVFFSIDQTTAP